MKARHSPPTEIESLISTRRFVRTVFALGIAASLAANVLHAEPNMISRIISGWPPVALIATVEMISRVRARSSWLSFARIVATGIVAGIAAWISYWHMAAVARKYGETTDAAHLIPFSVDGMIVVASICLVEISRRLFVLMYPDEIEAPAPSRRGWRRRKSAEALVDEPNDDAGENTPEDAPARRRRSLSSHADCTHENTRAARAACRRERDNTPTMVYNEGEPPTERNNDDEPASRPGRVDQGSSRWLS